MCSEQIALHTIGDEAQAFIVCTLLLATKASGNPRGQCGQLGRDEFDHNAGLGQRLEPGRLFFGPVQSGQGDQKERVRRKPGAIFLKGVAAVPPRFPGRNAQIDQRLSAEQ